MSKVSIGAKVVSLVTEHDVIAGREYVVAEVYDDGMVRVVDEIEDRYTLLVNEYIVPTAKAPVSDIRDIRGNTVYVRDTIAYAYGTGVLALFEVMELDNTTSTALVRSLNSSIVTRLGVLNERAVIIK